MIAVDVNVLAYRFIQGEKTDLACKLLKKDAEWVVPTLWRHEFLNVLATSARAGIIGLYEAETLWRDVFRIFQHREFPVLYEQALLLSVRFSISAYDAQYITLAREMNIPCITEDCRLLKTFSETAISMQTFLSR
jgi:predicted nucleic acid-binding protein